MRKRGVYDRKNAITNCDDNDTNGYKITKKTLAVQKNRRLSPTEFRILGQHGSPHNDEKLAQFFSVRKKKLYKSKGAIRPQL